jgi:predicted ATPase
MSGGAPHLRGLRLLSERVPGYDAYPFSIPALKDLDLACDAAVNIFVGENGPGKSTLLEALAVVIGIPASGGGGETRNGTGLPPLITSSGGKARHRALRGSPRRR